MKVFFIYMPLAFSLPAVVGAADKLGMQASLGHDGLGRWRGYGILRVDDWAFGAAGRQAPRGEFQGMAGINSPFLTLGHLSDAGLAAEIRNPDCTALSRLEERTMYRADLRSFSDSRYGIVLTPWKGRAGVVWERREGVDSAVIWGVPIYKKNWKLELLWSGGMLDSDDASDAWYLDYPDEAAHPGGALTEYAVRNQLEFGPWMGAVTGIVSAGGNFRPGLLLAGATGYSGGGWHMRMRGTWATEFFRTGEGVLPDVPVGIAWDGRYSPNRGPLLNAGLTLPLGNYGRASLREDESGYIGLGWRFRKMILRSQIDLKGIRYTPKAKKISAELKWSFIKHAIELKGSSDPEGEWSVRLKWAWEAGAVWAVESSVVLHQGTALLVDGRIKVSLRYPRGRFVLSCAAADIPRDWQNGPSSAGDLDIELNWIQDF